MAETSHNGTTVNTLAVEHAWRQARERRATVTPAAQQAKQGVGLHAVGSRVSGPATKPAGNCGQQLSGWRGLTECSSLV